MDYYIPIQIQSSLGDRANAFCQKVFPDGKCRICPDARGKLIYLTLFHPAKHEFKRIGRLTYMGDIDNLQDFRLINPYIAKYEPPAPNFEGLNFLDGTIEGALHALGVWMKKHKVK